MKKKLLIAGGILLALLAGFALFITNGLSAGMKVQIDGIDLSGIPDGSYSGTYEFKRWSNTLTVRVKNQQIIAIDIVEDMPAAQAEWSGETFRRVIDKQDTKVDAIAGATVSSKAYLKAIENALSQEK